MRTHPGLATGMGSWRRYSASGGPGASSWTALIVAVMAANDRAALHSCLARAATFAHVSVARARHVHYAADWPGMPPIAPFFWWVCGRKAPGTWRTDSPPPSSHWRVLFAAR